MKVDVCLSPALYEYYAGNNDQVVVVVDIFRASTTICTAFSNGARAIIPAATIEEAKSYKNLGFLVGAERNVKRCDFADFGNSPFDYTEERVKEEIIVLSTTNGTRAIHLAKDAYSLVIGAFSNLSAVADYCIGQNKNVIVLCAGWRNQVNIEDSLFGGALASILASKGYETSSDATIICMDMWRKAKSDIANYTSRSEHITRLRDHERIKDIDYCLQIDTVDLVPIYNRNSGEFRL